MEETNQLRRSTAGETCSLQQIRVSKHHGLDCSPDGVNNAQRDSKEVKQKVRTKEPDRSPHRRAARDAKAKNSTTRHLLRREGRRCRRESDVRPASPHEFLCYSRRLEHDVPVPAASAGGVHAACTKNRRHRQHRRRSNQSTSQVRFGDNLTGSRYNTKNDALGLMLICSVQHEYPMLAS